MKTDVNVKADSSLVFENHLWGFYILLESPQWFRKINIDVLKRTGLLRQHPKPRGALSIRWFLLRFMDFSCAHNDGCNEGRAPGKPAVVIPVPGKGGPISKVSPRKWDLAKPQCSVSDWGGGGSGTNKKLRGKIMSTCSRGKNFIL